MRQTDAQLDRRIASNRSPSTSSSASGSRLSSATCQTRAIYIRYITRVKSATYTGVCWAR